MRVWCKSTFRYLVLALLLPGMAFCIYKTTQTSVVPIKEYQHAKAELAKVIPPASDRLEDHSSGYHTYRAFSRYDYASPQSKEWIASFFTQQMESAGWQTHETATNERHFCKNGFSVSLSYSATRETRYSIGITLDGDKSSPLHKNCER